MAAPRLDISPTAPSGTLPEENAVPRQVDSHRAANGRTGHHPTTHDAVPLPLVVGIGASAGGLEALEALFRHMPTTTGAAFVVIQHLSPDFPSFMDELLARQTVMTIIVVQDGMRPAPDHIYLLPPGKEMEITLDGFVLRDKSSYDNRPSMPINTFFASLAAWYGENAAGVVLSGTGTDGASGLEAISAAGGLVLVQLPESAAFDGMPKAAAAACRTAVLATPDEMPDILAAFISGSPLPFEHPGLPTGPASGGPAPDALQTIFTLLQRHGGLDFRDYKPATIARRIMRRIRLEQHADIEGYARHLRDDPQAVQTLFRDLLIGVTTFFRDEAAFDTLAATVIPELFRRLGDRGEIRLWVAGCASGEEAYSLGMLLLEAAPQFDFTGRISIFATDVHRHSLDRASAGVYTKDSLQALSPRRLQRFFIPEGDETYRVAPELRSLVLFTQHNILADPPFTRVDLVSCRNLLIYFGVDAQERAIARLHMALRPGGVLFMGASETTGRLHPIFEPLDPRLRIFTKRPDTLGMTATHLVHPAVIDAHRLATSSPQPSERQLLRDYDALLQRFAPDGMLVDDRFAVLHFFGNGASYLTQHTGRTDRPITDMVEGDLRLALSSALQRASTTGETARFKSIRVPGNGGDRLVDVEVMPIGNKPSDGKHYHVALQSSHPVLIRPLVEPAATGHGTGLLASRVAELETELAETRSSLRDSIEQVHVTNEELQATNEELLSANEELQATNEELHSINEELYTVNAEFERKNDQLRILGEDYAQLFDTIPIAIASLDESLRVRRFNAGMSAIFHLQPHDVGRPLQQIASCLVEPDNLFKSLALGLSEGGTHDSEARLTDGRWCQQRIHAVRDETGATEHMLLTFMDITHVKHAEAIRQEARSLDEISRNVPGVVFKLCVPRNGNFRVEYVGGGTVELCGLSQEEIKADPHALVALFGPDVVPHILAGISATDGEGTPVDVEIPLHCTGGTKWVHVQATSTPARGGGTEWYGVAVDATERRYDATRMHNAADRYLRILDHAPMLIWRSDTTGACDWFNTTWLDFTGRTMEQEYGYGWAEGVHPDDYDRCVSIYQKAFALQQAFEMNYRLKRHDGQFRWLVDCGKPLPDLDGTFSGFIGYCYDITDAVNALESMCEASKRAEEANRTKSEFLANVSHELRTPLNGALGMLQLLELSPLSPEQRQYVTTAIRSGQNLVRLLSDILDLSRIEAGKLVIEAIPCDIRELVDEVFSTFSLDATGKGITLETTIAPGTPTYVRTDPLRLRQTLFNLVGNAVKFTEKGGVRVEFSTASMRGDAIVLFCTVRDTGPGIPEDRIESIFQPFTQLDGSYTRRHSGLGLGLGIVCRLMELFGGSIEVESAPDMGTAMHFAIPVGKTRRPQGRKVKETEDEGDRHALYLLVAEDDAINRLTLTRMLEQLGHRAHAVEDGSQALQALAEQHFDAVFLDIQMPVLDGMATLQAIRTGQVAGLPPTIPVVAVTAHAMQGDRERFMAKGADAYVQKPYDFTALEKALATLGRRVRPEGRTREDYSL